MFTSMGKRIAILCALSGLLSVGAWAQGSGAPSAANPDAQQEGQTVSPAQSDAPPAARATRPQRQQFRQDRRNFKQDRAALKQDRQQLRADLAQFGANSTQVSTDRQKLAAQRRDVAADRQNLQRDAQDLRGAGSGPNLNDQGHAPAEGSPNAAPQP